MMHYLECIAMLNYLLKKLCAGQRMQVPVGVVEDVQTNIIALQKRLDENSQELNTRINDVMDAVNTVRKTNGLEFLTEVMKTTLVDGVQEIHDEVCLKAYRYFQVNDFEPTTEIIPIMRNVVEVALQKGVI